MSLFKKKKKSYFVELEYMKTADEIITSHLVCTTDKRNIELSGILKGLGDEVHDWRILSVTRIDDDDAMELDKYLDEMNKSDR